MSDDKQTAPIITDPPQLPSVKATEPNEAGFPQWIVTRKNGSQTVVTKSSDSFLGDADAVQLVLQKLGRVKPRAQRRK